MKVTVRNLGVIKDDATIDLKPLTVFIGPNSSGKTWLAYAIAGILGSYGWHRYVSAYIVGKTARKYRKLDDVAKQIAEGGEGTLDIVSFAEEYVEKYLSDIALFSKSWMQRYLSTKRIQFTDLFFNIDVAELKNKLLQYIQQIPIQDNLGKNDESAPLRALKEAGERKLFFYPGQNIEDRLPTRAVREFVSGLIFREILQFFYSDVYVFPTERASVINDQFLPVSLSRRFIEKVTTPVNEEVSTAIEELENLFSKVRPQSVPVGSFANMMSRLYRSGSFTDRTEQALEQLAIKQYMRLADILQKDILGGDVDFSTPDPDPQREILFKPENDVYGDIPTLEISISSSMVKELSSLVLYLRYLAQPGEMVVIDEPEMNLHPEAQAKIIEFLVMLVNAGLDVLITTHSPYITDHLTNLIQASKHEDKESIKQDFFLQQSEAFIDKEKVSVYGFNDGKVNDVLDEDGVVSWNTFGDVSEKIADIFMKL
ncbi:MAG TPA: hypothetical protein DHW02_00045 [Ktedonobacter sp.]|nr:hypothetical protein [Ktedonobacter sp.]